MIQNETIILKRECRSKEIFKQLRYLNCLKKEILNSNFYTYYTRSVVCDDFSMRVHGMYNHHDCAIVLSVSGETDEMIQRIMLLKRCGVQVIIITNSASSSGAKMADLAICYYVPSSRNEDFYSSATQVPVIYILESLADTLEEYGII
ncbi:MAG: SIS domain-containing protein [Massilimicrobiota sp.]|nr:SIS domain-containing protein [Massilimicrobiota sp.]